MTNIRLSMAYVKPGVWVCEMLNADVKPADELGVLIGASATANNPIQAINNLIKLIRGKTLIYKTLDGAKVHLDLGYIEDYKFNLTIEKITNFGGEKVHRNAGGDRHL